MRDDGGEILAHLRGLRAAVDRLRNGVGQLERRISAAEKALAGAADDARRRFDAIDAELGGQDAKLERIIAEMS